MLLISPQDSFSLTQASADLRISGQCSFSYLQTVPGQKQIFDALRAGNVERLEQWIKDGACPDWADLVDNGETVDIAAVCSGSAPMVDFVLLNGGLNAYRRGPPGIEPPYHVAITHGYAHVIDVLTNHVQVSLEEHDRNGLTPLLLALAIRDYVSAEKLYRAGAGINTQDFDGDTPLHFAVSIQNRIMVNWLLERGALPNTQNAQGSWSPLHFAVFTHAASLAADLMRYGAWCELRDADGFSPWEIACNSKDISLCMALRLNAEWSHRCLRETLAIDHSMALRATRAVAAFAVDPHSKSLLDIGDEVIRLIRTQIPVVGNQHLHAEIFDSFNTKKLLQMRQLRSLFPYGTSDPMLRDIARWRLAVAMGVGNCSELARGAFYELLLRLDDRYTIELISHSDNDHVFVVVRTKAYEQMVVDPWPVYPHATRPVDYYMLQQDVRKEIYFADNEEGLSGINGTRIVDILNAQQVDAVSSKGGSAFEIGATTGFTVAATMQGIKGSRGMELELNNAIRDADKWAKALCFHQEYVTVFQNEIDSVSAYYRQVLWPTCLGGPVRYYVDTQPEG
jgi:hypothetical protein